MCFISIILVFSGDICHFSLFLLLLFRSVLVFECIFLHLIQSTVNCLCVWKLLATFLAVSATKMLFSIERFS